MPTDFYLRGATKNKIYCSDPSAINELKETITDYVQKVDDTVLKDVFRNMMTRTAKCTVAGGGHFLHLLQSSPSNSNICYNMLFLINIE